MTRQRRRHLSVAVAAGLAALVVDLLPLGIATQVWPGRIIALPVAILLGPWFGAIAALMAAAPYYTLPPVVAFILIEALIVGWFARRGQSATLAGTIVWSVFALLLMQLPALNGDASSRLLAVPFAMQRMLTGMSAVVLADFFSKTIEARWMSGGQRSMQHQRLRKYSFHAFVLVALLPAILLSTGAVLIIGQRQEAEGGVRLRDSARVLSDQIESYLSIHTHAMEALAATVAPMAETSAGRQQLLEKYAAVYQGFKALRLADRSGDVHTLVPRLPGTSEPLSVLDRTFFNERCTAAGLRSRTLSWASSLGCRWCSSPHGGFPRTAPSPASPLETWICRSCAR